VFQEGSIFVREKRERFAASNDWDERASETDAALGEV